MMRITKEARVIQKLLKAEGMVRMDKNRKPQKGNRSWTGIATGHIFFSKSRRRQEDKEGLLKDGKF